MNTGRTVFSQLMGFLPHKQFQKCVTRYRGDRKVTGFTCMDQFLCMAFAQLTYRESLRDIQACLRAMQPKLYHMGIRGRIAKSTLADANEGRDWRIYADYGTSENAVKTQVWIAVSVYVLVAILKKELRIERSLYEILQVLSVTIFEKTPILKAFSDIPSPSSEGDSSIQLSLFD